MPISNDAYVTVQEPFETVHDVIPTPSTLKRIVQVAEVLDNVPVKTMSSLYSAEALLLVTARVGSEIPIAIV